MFTYTERQLLLRGLELLIEESAHDVKWGILEGPSLSGIKSQARSLGTAGKLALELLEQLT